MTKADLIAANEKAAAQWLEIYFKAADFYGMESPQATRPWERAMACLRTVQQFESEGVTA